MSFFGDGDRRQIAIAAAGLALSVLLMIVPPLSIGGLSVWLYLVPALFVSYCITPRVFMGLVVLGVVLGYLATNQHASAFIAEAMASIFLLWALSSWRRVTSRVETLLLSVTLLTFVTYPLIALVNYHFSGVSGSQALYIATRYTVSSLLSVLLTELLIVTISLSERATFQRLRDLLTFRPSLVHVVELTISASVILGLVLMLSLFWGVWDRDVERSAVDATDARMQSFLATAELLVTREIQFLHDTTTWVAADSAGVAYPPLPKPLDGKLEASMYVADVDISAALQVGALTSNGQIVTTGNLSRGEVDDLLARARLKKSRGLVKLVTRDQAGSEKLAYVLLGDSRGDLVLQFSDRESAQAFTYSDALDRYNNIFYNPSNRLGAIGSRSVSDSMILDTATITHYENDNWVLWKPDTAISENTRMRAYSLRLDPATKITAPPSRHIQEAFEDSLHGANEYAITLSYWQFVESYIRIVVITTAASLVLLVLLLWSARLLMGGLVKPVSELTIIFESWRKLRGGELGSGAALQALDSKGLSALEDIRSLQLGFRSLAEDVMYGERRLSTIAANYDELLRSLSLGVLAVDSSSNVQFSNEAMGEIIAQRPEALARLKSHAAQMLATNTTVDEWQLTLEDRPPRHFVLVVNHRLDDRGQESGLWVIATDLTEQKQTNAQLIQASKLATLGEMSTGMAHELNQPLNVISLATSNLRYAIKKGKANEDNTLSKLDRIDSAVSRAANIIDHMRAYGRLAGEGLTEVNVGDMVRGSCNLLAEQLKLSNISLINRVPDSEICVQGNAIQLEQVLINLINNAKDAIREQEGSGAIVIDSEISEGRVLIRVTDTGGGIPAQVLPHIFEPFFTTKPVGKGTGLGGSISYGIVREMHGDIWAENVDGGAQITISLPLLVSQHELSEAHDNCERLG